MTRLDRYIWSSVFWAFFTVTLVLLGLDYVLTFIDQVKRVNDTYTMQSLLQVLMYRMPARFAEYIPISSLIGSLIGLGALAASSELTVMRAAGIPIWRIGLSALQPIILLSLIGVGISEYVAPQAAQKADLIEKLRWQQSTHFAVSGGVWIRTDSNFVYIDAADDNGVLYGVKIYTPDERQKTLTSIRTADQAIHLDDENWDLKRVTTTYLLPDTVKTEYTESIPWQVSFRPEHLFLATQEPEALSLSQSMEYQHYLAQQELNSARYQLAFWTKILRPLASIALVLVALSSVFGPLRSSTMGGRIFSGVMIGLVFQNGLNLFGKMSLAAGFAPLLGVAIPIVICALAGIILMRRAH